MAAKRRELEIIKMPSQGDAQSLAVRGSLSRDRASQQADPLDGLLNSQGHAGKVMLNLMEADLIDSSGYSWLLSQNSAFRQKGGAFVLHSIPPLVMQVLAMMRAELVFRIAKDEPEALKMLEGEPT